MSDFEDNGFDGGFEYTADDFDAPGEAIGDHEDFGEAYAADDPEDDDDDDDEQEEEEAEIELGDDDTEDEVRTIDGRDSPCFDTVIH